MGAPFPPPTVPDFPVAASAPAAAELMALRLAAKSTRGNANDEFKAQIKMRESNTSTQSEILEVHTAVSSLESRLESVLTAERVSRAGLQTGLLEPPCDNSVQVAGTLSVRVAEGPSCIDNCSRGLGLIFWQKDIADVRGAR